MSRIGGKVFMGNLSNIPIAECRFKVVFDFLLEIRFSKVSGIRKDVQTKYIREGGRNDMALMFNCPQESGVKLTFERGFTSEHNARMLLAEKRMAFVEISVLNPDYSVAWTYVCESQGITGWRLGELNAMGSEVLIETLELSTTGIMGRYGLYSKVRKKLDFLA